ncbi:MAG: Flp family type IVb pilin [Pseudomonadota bacterium]
MKNLVSRFIKDESGATAIEYGLIAALVATAIIGAFSILDVAGWFTSLNTSVTGQMPS